MAERRSGFAGYGSEGRCAACTELESLSAMMQMQWKGLWKGSGCYSRC